MTNELGIFHAKDRYYSKWEIRKKEVCVENTHTEFDPVKTKALTGDKVLSNGTIDKQSDIRLSTNQYAGVLALKSPTYGRHTNNKFLYKCIPGRVDMPIFLIPYDVHQKRKNRTSDQNITSNCVSNYYVLFKFIEWKEKHPIGCIIDVIGSVASLPAFYKYQIYLENMYFSKSRRNNFIRKKLNTLTAPDDKKDDDIINAVASSVPSIKDRTQEHVISIDPQGSIDLDDAFSCVKIDDNQWKVSIFIANVPIWLNVLDYWEHLPPTPSTIYMPDIKHPMLPNILGDNLISLIEKRRRIVFAMDMYICSCGITQRIEFNPAIISVKKNFRYEDDLKYNFVYSKLNTLAIKCNKVRQYMDAVEDSHDVVAFWMLCMNHEIGLKLQYENVGIFRSTPDSENKNIQDSISSTINTTIPKKIIKLAHNWNQERAKYTNANDNNGHNYIGNGLTAYAHSTSPIRRLVDIINLTRLQILLDIFKPTDVMLQLLENYEENVNIIDHKMNGIRKIQNKCDVLAKCYDVSADVSYDGYIISKSNCTKSSTMLYEYTISIPELNIVSYVDSHEDWEIYSKQLFQIHVFEDETTLHRKIKIKAI